MSPRARQNTHATRQGRRGFPPLDAEPSPPPPLPHPPTHTQSSRSPPASGIALCALLSSLSPICPPKNEPALRISEGRHWWLHRAAAGVWGCLVVSAPALVLCVQLQARPPCNGYVWCGCVLCVVAESVVVLLVDLLGGGRGGGEEGRERGREEGLQLGTRALQRQKQGAP